MDCTACTLTTSPKHQTTTTPINTDPPVLSDHHKILAQFFEQKKNPTRRAYDRLIPARVATPPLKQKGHPLHVASHLEPNTPHLHQRARPRLTRQHVTVESVAHNQPAVALATVCSRTLSTPHRILSSARVFYGEAPIAHNHSAPPLACLEATSPFAFC